MPKLPVDTRNLRKLAGIVILCCMFTSLGSAQEGTDFRSSQNSTSKIGLKFLEIQTDDASYQEGLYQIEDYLYILPDSTGTWTIDEVSSPAFADRFVTGKAADLNLTHPEVTWFWVRLTVHSRPEQDEKWLINFSSPEVTLFERKNKEGFSEKRSGTYLPFSQRYFQDLYGSLPILPLYLPSEQKTTYYFKVKAAEPFGEPSWSLLNQQVVSPGYLTHFIVKYHIYLSFNLGIMLAVSLYHLIFFFYNRVRAYLYFGLFVFSHFLLTSFFGGFGLIYFFQEYPAINNDYLFYFAVSGFIIFLITFSSAYLKFKLYAPNLNQILMSLVFMQLGYSFCMLLLRVFYPMWYQDYSVAFMKPYTFAIALTLILILLGAVLSWRKGFQPALIFLLAIGLTIIQQIINVLEAGGTIPIPQIITGDGGSTIGMLIFAIGLGQRFKNIQEAKIQAEIIQKEKQEESQHLKELDEFKSRFYTNITHEFRTPLTVIQGLADQIGENPHWKTKERVDIIKSNSDKLLQLINQMLDLSKLEAGKLEPDYIQSDAIKYLKYLIESFHSLAFSQKITLSFHASVKNSLMDYDPMKLQQIIDNLVSNAIKFTPEYGSIKVAAKTVDDRNDLRQLEIKIEDTGLGIPKEKLPFIFDRFYQVDDSSIRKGEGTGLGLALVKELINLMEGSIKAESEAGMGATFTIHLPIRNEALMQEIDPMPSRLIHVSTDNAFQFASDDLNIVKKADLPIALLVEDNQDVIYYLRNCLENHYQLLEANNGRKGIEKAFETIPDLIISDVMMPEMDGFELCKILKKDERTSHIPVVLLTAKATQADKMEGLTHGADAYLSKPFQKEELLIRMENLLELRKQIQQKYQAAPSNLKDSEDPFMQKIRDLIESHLDDTDFGVMPLSRALGMSRVQVHRKLKAITDISTSQYIRIIRLQKAHDLLKNSDLTIAEIGYQVGFKDPAHFSRSFSQHFGVAPNVTRK